MTKLDHRAVFTLLAIFLLAAVFFYPQALSDSNTFLREFVGSQLLSVLGFMTAVTIAAAISVHLHLNDLADKTEKRFDRTKIALNNSIISLIFLFILAMAVVIVKPLLPSNEWNSSLANSFAIILILFELLVMLDISRTVMRIPPSKDLK